MLLKYVKQEYTFAFRTFISGTVGNILGLGWGNVEAGVKELLKWQ